MEEELQKRNTDCVYFLASPLTCKKGLECEYRHSEIARLNPRDCWYWLAGSCLNPSCAFRHPPLESSKEASSEPAPLPSQFSTPGNKTNVPCYFYFNGFCNKGDRCSFLHASSLKSSSKTGSAIPDALPVENKLPARLDSPQTAPISAGGEDHFQQNENNGFVQSLSPRGPPSGSEEIPIGGREVEDFIPGRSDRGSEGHLDTCIEPEERWESSPGFDVLVGDKSENMGGYEDDPDRDSEGGDLNCRYLTRDYEDVNGYEPTYSDDAVLFERGAYTSYDGFDNGHPRRTPSPFLSRKRKLSPSRRGGIDLRDHLRKHRAADRGRRAADYSPRRFDPSRLVGRIKQRPRQSVVQRLGRRLGSQIESSNFMERNEALFARASQSGKVHFDESAPWKRRSGEEHASFTGPKSLAEIKEQKRRARESGECYDNMGNSSNAEEDFQGPKPLSEILKGKSRTNSAQNGDMSSC